jgi:subtilisin
MKIFIPLAFAFAVALGLIFVPPTMLSTNTYADPALGPTPSAASSIIPGEYIVELKPEFVGEPPTGDQGLSDHSLIKQDQNILIETEQAEQLVEDQGANVTAVYTRALNGFAIEGVQDVTPLIQDPAIESVTPNWRAYPQAQYLDNGLNRIDIDRAIGSTGGVASKPDNREQKPNIDVALIDQPVPNGHPDLNVVERINFIDGCGSRKLANGEILECYNQDGFHGAGVAGDCCARDNLGGVVGGMPGARITSLVICSVNYACPGDSTLRAWDWLVSHASTIEIASMSVGGAATIASSTRDAGNAVVNAGITFFISAGNDNRDATNFNYCGVTLSICVSALGDTDGKCGGLGPNTPTYAVGGSDKDDRRAPFSNFGSGVDIMAPGVQILSTYPGILSTPSTYAPYYPSGVPYIGNSEQGKYTGSFGGTSAAAPIAAGIGALIKLKNPSFTPAQIKTDMQAKAYSQTQSCDGFGKGGLVSGANSESSEKLLYAQPY